MNRIICSLLILSLFGCVPRLPERAVLNPAAIPNLEEGFGRVYVFMGFLVTDDLLSPSKQSLRGGLDGYVYIDTNLVSYVSSGAIIVDLPQGDYKIHWAAYLDSEFEEKHRHSAPYVLSVNSGETSYLEANVRRNTDTSADSLGIVGGAIGGLIAGSSVNFIDYFEDEQREGAVMMSEMKIADYVKFSREYKE